MIRVDYRFHVVPGQRDAFVFAYRSAQTALCQMLGLTSHELVDDRQGPFTLRMVWDSLASYQRFARTWLGAWLADAMGLGRDALASPLESRTGDEPAWHPLASHQAYDFH